MFETRLVFERPLKVENFKKTRNRLFGFLTKEILVNSTVDFSRIGDHFAYK